MNKEFTLRAIRQFLTDFKYTNVCDLDICSKGQFSTLDNLCYLYIIGNCAKYEHPRSKNERRVRIAIRKIDFSKCDIGQGQSKAIPVT